MDRHQDVDARPFFRVLAGILSVVAGLCVVLGLIELVKGNWVAVLIILVGVGLLGFMLRVAVTGGSVNDELATDDISSDLPPINSAWTLTSGLRALSDVEESKLDYYERYVYQAILDEIRPYVGKSIDPSRTRFALYDYDNPLFPSIVHCEIRRSDPERLDLDIIFGEAGPRLDAGPPAPVTPGAKHSYRIWEPYPGDFPDPETCLDQIRPFVRDWLEGRLALETGFAGSKAYRWILRRGDEILGKQRLLLFPYFAARRVVTEST